MSIFRILLPALLLLLAMPDAEAQRGKRPSSRSKRPSSSRAKQKQSSEFSQRLWYGAGGVLGLSGDQNINFAAVGLIPQVGYKVNDWLSVGPRVGVTWNTIKGTATDGSRQRSNTWSYAGGLFARGRIFDFYAQTELLALSDEQSDLVLLRGFPALLIDNDTGRPSTTRDTDTQWLIGAGYNAGVGAGISSDFAVFYNIFDSVESTRSPISFRVTLTYNY